MAALEGLVCGGEQSFVFGNGPAEAFNGFDLSPYPVYHRQINHRRSQREGLPFHSIHDHKASSHPLRAMQDRHATYQRPASLHPDVTELFTICHRKLN